MRLLGSLVESNRLVESGMCVQNVKNVEEPLSIGGLRT